MVKHTQTIRRQFADECLSVFDYFVKLALRGLTFNNKSRIINNYIILILEQGKKYVQS